MRVLELAGIVLFIVCLGCQDKREKLSTPQSTTARPEATNSSQDGSLIDTPVAKAASPETKDDSLVNEELKKLQGEWIVEVSMINGENQIRTKDGLQTTITMTIIRDKLTIVQVTQGNCKAIGAQLDFSFAIDPRKDPKQIELKDGKLKDAIDNPFSGRTLPAIYDLKNDKLLIAIAISPSPKRPEKFTTEKNSQDWQLVLKRPRVEK